MEPLKLVPGTLMSLLVGTEFVLALLMS